MLEHSVDTEARVVPPLFRLTVRKANAITPLNSQGLALSFFCVHPIAGDVTSFSDLAHLLDKIVSMYGIQVPREMMTSSFGSSIEAMARHYVSAINAFRPEGPIVLGGWSAGAIIALEMAQQLQANGREVPLLIAFDGAPCNAGSTIGRFHPLFAWKVLRNFPFWVREEARQATTFSQFVRNVRDKLNFRIWRAFPALQNDQTLHGDDVKKLLVSRKWSDTQMGFIRALYEAMRNYQPRAYAGQVLVFESYVQPLLSLRQVGSAWQKLSPLAHIVMLKTNHMGIFREPTLSSLSQSLLDHLNFERC